MKTLSRIGSMRWLADNAMKPEMQTVSDLRQLKIGETYEIHRMPGGYKHIVTVGKVVPDPDHPNWGSIYDQQGKYVTGASYCEYLQARRMPEVQHI